MEREGLSLEEAARRLRYDFLRQEAEKLGQHIKIYTAHHADDNAETILFNLIRGTGVAGLTGMAYQQNGICRPLLDVTREELAAYAAARHIPHVEDTTNADPGAAARNFLRLEVMPRLRQINPRAVEHINDAGRRLRVADQSLEEEAARRTAHVEVQEGRVTLSRQALAEATDAVRPRMLLRLFDLLGVGRRDITAAHLKAILHLTRDTLWGRESRVDLPQGVTARYCREWLILETRPQLFDGGPAVAGVPRRLGRLPDHPAGSPGGGGTCPSALAAGGADGPDGGPCGAGRPSGSAGDPRGRPQHQTAVHGPPDLPPGAGPAAGRLRGRMPGGGVAAGRGYGVCSTGGGALPVHSDYRSGKGERFDMKSEMERDILKVLVTEEELKARITEMGAELYEQFHGKNPLFLGVLKGSFVFMADLVRACQVKSDVEFIAVSSYQNATVSSGRVQITHDLQQDITGRHLIIVEDILDSGNTLAFLKDYFMTKGAASITIVTLLDKPSRRTKAITADLAGFVVPDEFVVGYGLDYCQQYRNVPYIGVLKPEVYSGE